MDEMVKIRKLLFNSLIAGGVYGGAALLVGIFLQYNVLLLDGVYTLIGAIMSFLSLYIAKYIQTQDFERFPFGKEALLPLIVFIQYSIILLISIYGIIESVMSLIYVGEIKDNRAVFYFSVLGMFYCLLFYLYLKRQPLMHSFYQIELEQWRFGFYFSLGVFASVVFSTLIQLSEYKLLAKYVDPVISIGITLYFIYLSLRELKQAILELTSSTPKYELRKKLLLSIDKIFESKEIETYLLRVAKVGNQVIVEVDIVIWPNSELDAIQKQDMIREQLDDIIRDQIGTYSLWLNVNFIGDIKWAYEDSEIS